MICPNCLTELPDGFKFCGQGGTPLSGEDSEASAEPDTGMVIAGAVGRGRASDYAITGDAANTAARLETAPIRTRSWSATRSTAVHHARSAERGCPLTWP